MSTNYYPAYPPSWFQAYSLSSMYYDPVAAVWHYLALGSRNGNKDTFRQYLFMLGPPYTAVAEYPIAIPIVHALMESAAGRLYIFGQSERDLFWQDGPVLGQSFIQKTIALVRKPAPPFQVLTKAQHDFLPVRWPDMFEREWKRRAA